MAETPQQDQMQTPQGPAPGQPPPQQAMAPGQAGPGAPMPQEPTTNWNSLNQEPTFYPTPFPTTIKPESIVRTPTFWDHVKEFGQTYARMSQAGFAEEADPGGLKREQLAQTKAYQTGELSLGQQKVDIEKRKQGIMEKYYGSKDAQAWSKLGQKRDPETGDIVPDESSLAYQKQQMQQKHYEDLKAHYNDQMVLGLLKDQLGKETNEIKRKAIKEQIKQRQASLDLHSANLQRQWSKDEYQETGNISPTAQRQFGMATAAPTSLLGSAGPLKPVEAPEGTPEAPAGRVKAAIPPAGERGQQRMGLKSLDAAVKGDQGYQLLQESYDRVQKTGEIKGNDAMMALGAHVGSSIGTIPGIRIGKDLIEAHLKARSLPEDLEAHYNRITSGGGISRDQLQQWWNTAQSARVQRWSAALKESAGIGGAALEQTGRAIPRGITIPMTGPDGKQYNVKSERAVEAIQKYGARPL